MMAIILVMAIKPVNAWELKHHKKENDGPLYFKAIITCRGYKRTLIIKLALKLV